MPDAGPHTLKERLAAATDLAPAERKVAEFFAESGEQVAFLPAVKIAAVLGVSNATVVRTAQRLGYQGLPQLKKELQQAALRGLVTSTERFAGNPDELKTDADDLPQPLMAVRARLLTGAGRTLRPREFRRAVELLAAADRIVVLGLPPHTGIAEQFVHGLRRIGRRALVIGRVSGELAEELLELGQGDALVLVSYITVETAAIVALDHARQMRVPRILVTDTLALALKGRYTVALTASGGGGGEFPTATVPLAVLEALLLGVSREDRKKTLATFHARDALRGKLE